MNNNPSPVKTSAYYGLRLISLIYKMLCMLIVIICLGGLGYVSIEALSSRSDNYADFSWWLSQALSLVIGGGLLALTFYVIAQVVEIQLAVNKQLNQVLKNVDEIPKAIQTFEASTKQMVGEIEKLRLAIENQTRLSRLQNSPNAQPTPSSQQHPPISAATTKKIP